MIYYTYCDPISYCPRYGILFGQYVLLLQIYNDALVGQYILLPLSDDIFFGHYELLPTLLSALVDQYILLRLSEGILGKYITTKAVMAYWSHTDNA